MTAPAVQQWTQEQVERLARDFMGWEVITGGPDTFERIGNACLSGSDPPLAYIHPNTGALRAIGPDGGDSVEWNLFADAGADYRVLQRARQVWGREGRNTLEAITWGFFCEMLSAGWRHRAYTDSDFTHPARYEVGDYARAVLAVLDSQETNR